MRYLSLIFIIASIFIFGHVKPQGMNDCVLSSYDNTCDTIRLKSAVLSHCINRLPDSLRKQILWHEIEWHYIDSLHYSEIDDTLYIIQQNGIQGEVLLHLWNKINSASFINESGILRRTHKTLFSNYVVKLVSTWNTTELKNIKGNLTTSSTDDIYAFRILIKNKRCHIDFCRFEDAFDFERDQWDFIQIDK